MAESAALNSRQISRMHNKATSHGNPLSLSLSISISLSRRAEKKNDRPPSFFPLFCIFLELATICEPYGEEDIPLPLLLRSDFELEPRDFIEKLSFSLSSFYLDELPPR